MNTQITSPESGTPRTEIQPGAQQPQPGLTHINLSDATRAALDDSLSVDPEPNKPADNQTDGFIAVESPPISSDHSPRAIFEASLSRMAVNPMDVTDAGGGTTATPESDQQEVDVSLKGIPRGFRTLIQKSGIHPALFYATHLTAIAAADLGYHRFKPDDESEPQPAVLHWLASTKSPTAMRTIRDSAFRLVVKANHESVRRQTERQIELDVQIKKLGIKIRELLSTARKSVDQAQSDVLREAAKLEAERQALIREKKLDGDLFIKPGNPKAVVAAINASTTEGRIWTPNESVLEEISSDKGTGIRTNLIQASASPGDGGLNALFLDSEEGAVNFVNDHRVANSGYLDEVLFVSSGDSAVPMPAWTPADRNFFDEAIQRIQRRRATNASRDVAITQEAKDALLECRKFYKNRQSAKKTTDENRGGWGSKADIKVQRICLALSLLQKEELTVTAEIVATADWIVRESNKQLADFLAKGAEFRAESSDAAKLRRALFRAGGPIWFNDLSKYGLSKLKVDRLISELPSVFVEIRVKHKGKGGPKKHVDLVSPTSFENWSKEMPATKTRTTAKTSETGASGGESEATAQASAEARSVAARVAPVPVAPAPIAQATEVPAPIAPPPLAAPAPEGVPTPVATPAPVMDAQLAHPAPSAVNQAPVVSAPTAMAPAPVMEAQTAPATSAQVVNAIVNQD